MSEGLTDHPCQSEGYRRKIKIHDSKANVSHFLLPMAYRSRALISDQPANKFDILNRNRVI